MLEKINLSELKSLSKEFVDSQFFDKVTLSQAVVKILAGRELGLEPFSSMSGIHIIKGKPCLAANAIATLIANSNRYAYKVLFISDEFCEIQFYENKQKSGTSSFSTADAKRACLVGNDNWKKYPSAMLFARALTQGARRFSPGIFGGSPIYTPEELGADLDEDGFIIDVESDKNDESVKESSKPKEIERNDPVCKSVMEVQNLVSEALKKGACSDKFVDHIFTTEKIEDWLQMTSQRADYWIKIIQGRIKKFDDEKLLEQAKESIEDSRNLVEQQFGETEILSAKNVTEEANVA